MNIKLLAPAKINLGLEIYDLNSDGYHDVDMVMQTVSLYDEISLSIDSNKNDVEILSNVDVKCDKKKNTVYIAAKEFYKYVGLQNVGIKIKINKSIPMGAGLAGGSTDAAATIVGMNLLYGANLSNEDMCNIGSKVGSDVPFCIIGGTASAGGRGTILKPINPLPECSIVIVKPDVFISTKEAYHKFDKLIHKKPNSLENLKNAFAKRSLNDICKNLYNRFEEVIDNNEISCIKSMFLEYGALGALMTGSGSAVYGIFNNEDLAKKCSMHIKKVYNKTYFTVPVSTGAVPIQKYASPQ